MRNLVKSLRLTLVFCVFFSICYILVLWIFGLIVGPGGGNAETLVLNGRVVGRQCWAAIHEGCLFLGPSVPCG